MVNWQLTATTIYCEVVADEVTFLVYKDGSVRCTGEGKHASGRGGPPAGRGRAGKMAGAGGCRGKECTLPAKYRDRLFAEETGRAGKKGPDGSAR